MTISEETEMKIDKRARKRINAKLQEISKKYHPAIPTGEIRDALADELILLLQEDGTVWSGILCGNSSRTTFEISGHGNSTNFGELPRMYEPFEDCLLDLSWYKMPSGNYEINAYLS